MAGQGMAAVPSLTRQPMGASIMRCNVALRVVAAIILSQFATPAVPAGADYKRLVKLPHEYLGFFEALGEDEHGVFDGSRCKSNGDDGGNPIDKIEITQGQ